MGEIIPLPPVLMIFPQNTSAVNDHYKKARKENSNK